MNAAEKDPREWIRRAEQDRTATSAVVALQEPREIAAFHAQQLAEKHLKAFLISKGWTLKKTYDLSDLHTDAFKYDPSWEGLADDCELLTPFAVAGRYPLPRLTRSTCEAAIAAAERIRAEIPQRLPAHA